MATDLNVFGRKLGTVDGWDEVEILHLSFYDFVSAVPELPSADCISINYETSAFEAYDDKAEVIFSVLLKDLKN